jgi:hypothetical protein
MLDMATGNLLQVELNTISSSFAALGSLVTSLHRYPYPFCLIVPFLLLYKTFQSCSLLWLSSIGLKIHFLKLALNIVLWLCHGRHLINWSGDRSGLEAKNVPENSAADTFAEALALAWKEYGDNRAVVLMVVREEERNMYDQYWLALKLFKSYGIKLIRKTLSQVIAEGKLGSNNELLM